MKTINKDILTVESGIIVHQVNCMGVMGSGLAKQIREKWPTVYGDYKHGSSKYNHSWKLLGEYIYTQVGHDAGGDLVVASVFGQYNYGQGKHTEYCALNSALVALRQEFWSKHWKFYFPYQFGCGLGGGDWNVVQEILEETIGDRGVICRL